MKPRPFARRRESKKLDEELGTQLWRQVYDRFARSLDRYWQIIDPQNPGDIPREELNGLIHAGNVLTEQLVIVRAVCLHAKQEFGERDLDIPAGASTVHRTLSRASNDLATTAQAAAMFKRGQASLESVGLRAGKVIDAVATAQRACQDLKPKNTK